MCIYYTAGHLRRSLPGQLLRLYADEQMGDISSPTYPVQSELELFLDQRVFGVNVPVKRTAKGYSKMPFPKIHMWTTYT